jgi:hypothetical protein
VYIYIHNIGLIAIEISSSIKHLATQDWVMKMTCLQGTPGTIVPQECLGDGYFQVENYDHSIIDIYDIIVATHGYPIHLIISHLG